MIRPDDDAFELVIACGKACEMAMLAAAQDAASGRIQWAASHIRRARTRAQMALFIASGGRHG